MSPTPTRVPSGCPRCGTVEHHLVDVMKVRGSHIASCDHCALLWVPSVIDMRAVPS